MNAREVMVKENCGMQPANRSEERRTGACRSFCWLNGKSVGQLSVDVAASIAPLAFRLACCHQRQRLP